MGLYERVGGQLGLEDAKAKQHALAAVGPEVALNLQTLSAKRPTATELLGLFNRKARSRYASSAPSDAKQEQMVARRLLSPGDSEVTAQDASLAIELLADRGLTLNALPEPLTLSRPIELAHALAVKHQISVLMLAYDSLEELVAVIVEADGVKVQRPHTPIGTARVQLREWLKVYPIKYGRIEPQGRMGDSEFYDSMRPFKIPLPEGDRILVMAEPEVAQLAFNLALRDDRHLIGYDTAIGMVPSLTWLEDAHKRTRVSGDRRVAWISDGSKSEEMTAMQAVAGMMEQAFESHDITLDTSQGLPQSFSGAHMAIVVAHGQLASGDRYFRRVSDEGVLQEAPIGLAQSLAQVELVILFVCSGGRLDRDPVASTMVGLPKMLLEQGCLTVIASPWPFETLAAAPWLRGFLEHWERDATAMDACHEANMSMAVRYENQPQISLAMTVYGDPLLVRPHSL